MSDVDGLVVDVGILVLTGTGVAVSWYFANKAVNASREAQRASDASNRIASGQAEVAIRDGIQAARERVDDLLLRADELAAMPSDERTRDRTLRLGLVVRSATEAYLNRYEHACQQYSEGKLDRTAFKGLYAEEIRTICTAKTRAYRDLLQGEAGRSKYIMIWRVFRQWYPDDSGSAS